MGTDGWLGRDDETWIAVSHSTFLGQFVHLSNEDNCRSLTSVLGLRKWKMGKGVGEPSGDSGRARIWRLGAMGAMM